MVNFRDALKAGMKDAPEETEAPKKATPKKAASPEASKASSGWLTQGDMTADEPIPKKPSAGSYGPSRFWLPRNGSAEVIFLSPGQPLPIITEHQVQLYGNWRNWATCLRMIGEECLLCKYAKEHEKFFAYSAAFLSIIDTSEYTSKRDGKVYKDQKRLFVAKSRSLEFLKRRYAQRVAAGETLRASKYQIFRSNDKTAASVGDQFDYINTVDLNEYPDTEEYNLEELFAPNAEKVQSMYDALVKETGAKSFETGSVDF